MSNVDLQEPVVEPDSLREEPVNSTAPKPKRRVSKIMLIGGLVLLGLIVWSFMAPKKTEVKSTVIAPPELNTTAGGEVQQSSQEYANSLRNANDQNAALALESGTSFIPTPEGVLTPIVDAEETLPSVAVEQKPTASVEEPVVVRKRAVVPQLRKMNEAPVNQQMTGGLPENQGGEQPENPYIGLISSQMNVVSSTFVPPVSETEEFRTTDNAERAQTDENAYGDGARIANSGDDPLLRGHQPVNGYDSDLDSQTDVLAGLDGSDTVTENGHNQNVLQPQDQKRTSKVYVAAGDLMYGEVIATVNSDAAMPVMAEITTGQHKGARVRGTFDTDKMSGKLTVTFSQMTKGDVTVPITAVAVDGFTADTSVRSGIERRYLRRYGTVFAATFIEGLAEGKAEPEKRVIEDSDGDQRVVEEKRTSEESLWHGVQKSVGAISRDLTDSAPKGPKIYLHSGYPIGILFLDDLREDPDSLQDGA